LLAGMEEAEEVPRRDAALPVVWREVLWRSAGVAGIRGEAGGFRAFQTEARQAVPEVFKIL